VAGIALLSLGVNQGLKEREAIAVALKLNSTDFGALGAQMIDKAHQLDPELALGSVALGTRACVAAQIRLSELEQQPSPKKKAIDELKTMLDNAASQFDEATKRDPKEVLAHTGLGYTFLLQGRVAAKLESDGKRAGNLFDRAAYDLKQASELNPALKTAHYYLANLYMERKQWSAAEDAYARVKPDERSPDLAKNIYIGMALAREHQGKEAEARDAVQAAARLGLRGDHWVYAELKLIKKGHRIE
jgi:tetratricopeptide (TPR) repeat protein